MNYRIYTIAAALALLLPACIGLLASGAPTLIAPFPLLTVWPAFLLANAGLYWLSVLVPSGFFMLWNPQLLRGVSNIPIRTVVLFLACAILNIVWFIGSWS